jgi:hypothetical protein
MVRYITMHSFNQEMSMEFVRAKISRRAYHWKRITDKQRDRQTDKQTSRQTDKQTDGWTKRQTGQFIWHVRLEPTQVEQSLVLHVKGRLILLFCNCWTWLNNLLGENTLAAFCSKECICNILFNHGVVNKLQLILRGRHGRKTD